MTRDELAEDEERAAGRVKATLPRTQGVHGGYRVWISFWHHSGWSHISLVLSFVWFLGFSALSSCLFLLTDTIVYTYLRIPFFMLLLKGGRDYVQMDGWDCKLMMEKRIMLIIFTSIFWMFRRFMYSV